MIIVTVPIGGTSFAYKDVESSPATEKNDFMNKHDVDRLFLDEKWQICAGFMFGYSYFGVYFCKPIEEP